MDILNFISWIVSKKRVVTSVPDDALIPVGISTPQTDDKYTTVAIKKSDLLAPSALPCPLTLNFKSGSVGEKVSFKKENYANPIKSRDVIIPGVLEITRGNNGGIYNAVYQNSYSNQGPLNTEWNTQYVNPADTSWAPLWDIQNRTYLKWQVAIETPSGNNAPPQYVGMHTIMRETTTNRYWLIIFTEWTANNNGGGFAYDRYEIYPEVYFSRPNYQFNTTDKISDGVVIARESNGGAIFNLISEQNSNAGLSPENTRWNSIYTDTRSGYSGFSDLSNLESRVYTDFINALDYQVGNHVLNTDLIMHDLTTDLYYKVVFDSWQQGGNGGGFSYYRTVIPQSCSVTFADGTVLNTASTSGSAVTTCCYTDINNNLIAADSSNNLVSLGSGATQDIPNFSGMLLVNDHFNGGVEMWLCGGGVTTVLVSSTPYGPGPGDLVINGNGYQWKNINNQVGPFTFTAIKTRSGS